MAVDLHSSVVGAGQCLRAGTAGARGLCHASARACPSASRSGARCACWRWTRRCGAARARSRRCACRTSRCSQDRSARCSSSTPHDDAADVDYQPVDLDQPAVLIDDGVAASPGNPQFHQQMVYGVASAVYATFRAALGRDPAFAVPVDATGRARLRLRPHAAPGLNAWYDRHRGEIAFGYAPGPDGLRLHVPVPRRHRARGDPRAGRWTAQPVRVADQPRRLRVSRRPRPISSPSSIGSPTRRSCARRCAARGATCARRGCSPTSRARLARPYRWPALRRALDDDPDHPTLYDPPLWSRTRWAGCWWPPSSTRSSRCSAARPRATSGWRPRGTGVLPRAIRPSTCSTRWPTRLSPGTAVPVDLHPRHRLLPAGGHRVRRVPARRDHRRPRSGARRPVGLPRGVDRGVPAPADPAARASRRCRRTRWPGRRPIATCGRWRRCRSPRCASRATPAMRPMPTNSSARPGKSARWSPPPNACELFGVLDPAGADESLAPARPVVESVRSCGASGPMARCGSIWSPR